HYVWGPAGCVFVEGYWDHPLLERGLLFAPIRVEREVLVKRWVYTPSFVIQPDFLLSALFVRPARHHYYFGDYFTADYRRSGFVPWVDYRVTRTSFDPDFAYYRREYRGRVWERNLRQLYAARFEGTVARPPRTPVQQNTVIQNITQKNVTNVTVNKTLNITNIQNVNVLAPVTKIQNTRVTALASLAHPVGTAPKPAEVKRVVKLDTVTKQERVQVQKH